MIIDKNWITSNLWPSVPDNYQKKRAIGDKVGYLYFCVNLVIQETVVNINSRL